METGKKAVESVKETAANIGASSISGKMKTKATMEGQMEKMRAKDEIEKGLASERTEARITEAELRKERAQTHNLDYKEARIAALTGAGDHSHPIPDAHALPGQPDVGYVVDGAAVGSHPIEAENRHVGGGTANTGLTGTGA